MNSILSYPERGPFGRADYRGNCSGYIVRDLIAQYTDQTKQVLVVDPMQGSGTSHDVCQFLNTKGHSIEYTGLDLNTEFNILKNEICPKLTRPADLVFIHPPYHNMLRYSGTVWGSQPLSDDLSHCPSYPDFLSKLQLALQNAYRALRPGGHYCLLIGDLRKNGDYFHISSDIRQLAPGQLADVIIKQQHNCVSDQTTYDKQKLIRIAHEYILTFRKTPEPDNSPPLDATLTASSRLQVLSNANWTSLTVTALEKLGGRATLEQLCNAIERTASTSNRRPNWTTKVLASLNRLCLKSQIMGRLMGQTAFLPQKSF